MKGKVSDQDGKPLQGVNVYFQGTFKGNSTLEDGTFTLKSDLPTPQTLVFSMIGYETVTDTILLPGTYTKILFLQKKTYWEKKLLFQPPGLKKAF
ncbi:carboxypeptidase-like regulatory domain-containing protein [Mangrovivirga cuniculi]|uniref:carboxypeptidase-like regulatory domain-containing protein n=1 Tax=Mangrovivirga cuniculi TaxID=2715131 RepID=UPI0015862BB5|nr:carboxypeptidase-like regulatory domain-containing protein [Mangrovivirga cuniculi]